MANLAPEIRIREAAHVLDCGRCRDSGKVSRLNLLTRRSLDPDLTQLIRASTFRIRPDVDNWRATIDRLLARSGFAALGAYECYGEVVFVDDGDDRLPVALSWMPTPQVSVRYALTLFESGGKVIDHVLIESSADQVDINVGWVLIESGVRVLQIKQTGNPSAAVLLVRGASRSVLTSSDLRITPRFGRLEVAERTPPSGRANSEWGAETRLH